MDRRHDRKRDDHNDSERDHDRNGHGGKHRVRFKPKETPGVICIERHIHDEAVVISGSLTIEYHDAEVNAWIEEELGTAAGEVKERGGIVGQIKAAVTLTSTSIITVMDDRTAVKEPPQKYARIMLAAIMFMVSPKEAENIVRNALVGIRTRIRYKKHNGESRDMTGRE